MKRHLQCAKQQVSLPNLTKYCACHVKWLSSLILVTYETSFTMRETTGVIVQPHQILRLPRKMTLMIDLRHIWNVIYNARSNRGYAPTSPNTAAASKSNAWTSPNALPATRSATWTSEWLDSAITWLCYYFSFFYYLTLLLQLFYFNSSITWLTWLYYYLLDSSLTTLLLLDLLDSPIT